MAKTYIIYCEPCGFKKIVLDPSDVGLPEVETSSIQGRIPVLDKEIKKTKTFPHITTMPKFKCGQCGRVVTLRKFNVPRTPEVKTETDANPNKDQAE